MRDSVFVLKCTAGKGKAVQTSPRRLSCLQEEPCKSLAAASSITPFKEAKFAQWQTPFRTTL
ncbi:hypothetical protein BDV29DRAFT_183538 [Aspergillus leporis]|uniref:Uncharacterized protein n=1 Tax=Aspergillus leporis TaxID=41062 RepID=A0A5N5WKE7_9EURO|nr:hypothetical protein BDV29DRAFT_183538 [Aspergillus leporis]